MTIRPIKNLSLSQPTLEGAGVKLNRAFGFGDTGLSDPFLLLDDFRIYVQPINHPTVPRGTERLRITCSPNHSQKMIKDLVKAIKTVFGNLRIKYAA